MGTPEKPSSAPVEMEGAIRAVSELALGSRIVYPNQGVCRVGEIVSKEIAGHRLDFVSMTREEDDATILVPVNKVPSIGLRHVADSEEIGDVFDLLASSFDDPELDWKVRHRMHGDLMAAGGVLGVAEVLKALQGLANLRPLPQKERERYDAARHLLVHEIAVALGVPECTAEDFIDLALIPPPGTIRPASKPRRLATLPPRMLQKPVRAGARNESEEDEFGFGDEELPGLGLDEDLGEGEGGEEGESAEEAGGAEEDVEAEAQGEKPEESRAKKAKAPPKKPKAAARGPMPEEAKESAIASDVEAAAAQAIAPFEALPILEPGEAALEEIEGEPLLEDAPEFEPSMAGARGKASTEKPAAKKAPAKTPAAKSPAKATATKTAAPKKTPAKKADEKPAKKPAPKKAPAKKPAAKEAPSKKAAAKPTAKKK